MNILNIVHNIHSYIRTLEQEKGSSLARHSWSGAEIISKKREKKKKQKKKQKVKKKENATDEN
jgi:hypothetical protein